MSLYLRIQEWVLKHKNTFKAGFSNYLLKFGGDSDSNSNWAVLTHFQPKTIFNFESPLEATSPTSGSHFHVSTFGDSAGDNFNILKIKTFILKIF